MSQKTAFHDCAERAFEYRFTFDINLFKGFFFNMYFRNKNPKQYFLFSCMYSNII